MKIKFTGLNEQLQKGIKHLEQDLGISIGEGDRTIAVGRVDKGFEVVSDGKSAVIQYDKPNDFFRALTFTVNSFREDSQLKLKQVPSFETCGVMLDASRGAVPKVETVKDVIRRMARMGLNQLMLYTEDTYEMKKYPFFGYMRGRYSIEELKELDSYAIQLGVELVPCIQTLGHLAKPLRWSAFNEVKESESILFIGEEKTYEFIEEMIKTMRECFSTHKIHIGMDEAHGVGMGRYFKKHGYRDSFALLSEHLNVVKSIAEKYGFSPMMWSDMFFRLGSKTNDYYNAENVLPENIAEFVPENVSQVYWDYYNTSEEVYEVMMQGHKMLNADIVFAGGLWTWGRSTVSYKQTFDSMLPALKLCKKQGIKSVLATLWGDNGAECDLYQALYGIQLFAEYNYCNEFSVEQLNCAFKICNNCDAKAFLLFDIDNFPVEKYSPVQYSFAELEDHIVNISTQALYQNPMLGMFDKNFESIDFETHYSKIYNELCDIEIPVGFETLFDCHKQLVKVMMNKGNAGIRIRTAYHKKDKGLLKTEAERMFELAEDMELLYEKRKKLWYENNKPFGFELTGNRLASMAFSVRLAGERIMSYVNGDVDILEELEQELLYYNSLEQTTVKNDNPMRMMIP